MKVGPRPGGVQNRWTTSPLQWYELRSKGGLHESSSNSGAISARRRFHRLRAQRIPRVHATSRVAGRRRPIHRSPVRVGLLQLHRHPQDRHQILNFCKSFSSQFCAFFSIFSIFFDFHDFWDVFFTIFLDLMFSSFFWIFSMISGSYLISAPSLYR